jgi:hypothetical protein
MEVLGYENLPILSLRALAYLSFLFCVSFYFSYYCFSYSSTACILLLICCTYFILFVILFEVVTPYLRCRLCRVDRPFRRLNRNALLLMSDEVFYRRPADLPISLWSIVILI